MNHIRTSVVATIPSELASKIDVKREFTCDRPICGFRAGCPTPTTPFSAVMRRCVRNRRPGWFPIAHEVAVRWADSCRRADR